MNCGLWAPESKRQSVFALAGSWMSRTTIVESSPTLPITRVSPAGIAASQRTSPAPPGVPGAVGPAEVAADGLAVALDVTIGCAVGRGEVLLEDGEIAHAESANALATTASLKSTR